MLSGVGLLAFLLFIEKMLPDGFGVRAKLADGECAEYRIEPHG